MKGHKKIPEEYREEAEEKALATLSRNDYTKFGFWAGTWVQMNKLCRVREVDPFVVFANLALKIRKGEIGEKQ